MYVYVGFSGQASCLGIISGVTSEATPNPDTGTQTCRWRRWEMSMRMFWYPHPQPRSWAWPPMNSTLPVQGMPHLKTRKPLRQPSAGVPAQYGCESSVQGGLHMKHYGVSHLAPWKDLEGLAPDQHAGAAGFRVSGLDFRVWVC